jgi:hypothetical protein
MMSACNDPAKTGSVAWPVGLAAWFRRVQRFGRNCAASWIEYNAADFGYRSQGKARRDKTFLPKDEQETIMRTYITFAGPMAIPGSYFG